MMTRNCRLAVREMPGTDYCDVNVLRDAMAVDRLDKCGIYFGTTGGQVYASADAGDSWNAIVREGGGVRQRAICDSGAIAGG